METPTFNEWFLAQPEGRQAVLREDKWMLASSSYEAGVKGKAQEFESLLREFSLFLENLPEDLGRGSLNGSRVQLMHKLQLQLTGDAEAPARAGT